MQAMIIDLKNTTSRKDPKVKIDDMPAPRKGTADAIIEDEK